MDNPLLKYQIGDNLICLRTVLARDDYLLNSYPKAILHRNYPVSLLDIEYLYDRIRGKFNCILNNKKTELWITLEKNDNLFFKPLKL